jgi:hypothetical protein
MSDDTVTQRQPPCKIHTATKETMRDGIRCFSDLRLTLTFPRCSVASDLIRRNTPVWTPNAIAWDVQQLWTIQFWTIQFDTCHEWQYAERESHVEPPFCRPSFAQAMESTQAP